jgi:hypothetical protein
LAIYDNLTPRPILIIRTYSWGCWQAESGLPTALTVEEAGTCRAELNGTPSRSLGTDPALDCMGFGHPDRVVGVVGRGGPDEVVARGGSSAEGTGCVVT